MKTQIEQVIEQANLLGSLEIGATWFTAARLCGVPENEVATTAEIACFQQLNQEMNDPKLIEIRMRAYRERIALETGVQALVEQWAKAVGKLGGGCSQSRQSKRRKLRKNGLNSAYADKMRAEIAAANASA